MRQLQPEGDDIHVRLADVAKRCDKLATCPPVLVVDANPPTDPGVYAFFTKEDCPCYVGRTSNLRRRIQQHRRGNGRSGHLPATIERHDDGTQIGEAKRRVRAMTVRWVVVKEDDHGVRQALLELYAAVQLPTLLAPEKGRYNTFENH